MVLALGASTVASSLVYPWVRALSARRGLLALTATATYLLFLAALRWWRSIPRTLILSVGLGAFVAMCLPHPAGTDLWSYQMSGRLVTEYHTSPYRVTPNAFPDDVIARRTGLWSGTRTEYGPALVGVAVAASLIASDSPGVIRSLWQGLCAVCAATILIGMYRRGISAAGLAAFAFSPLVLYQGVYLAHIDMLIAVLVAAALVVIQRHPGWALTCLAVAAMVKIPIAAAWLVAAIWVFRQHPRRRALVHIGPSVLLTLAAVSIAGGRHVFEPMFAARNRTNQYAVWNLLRGAVETVTTSSVRAYPLAAPGWMSLLSAISIAVVCGAAGVVAWRRPGRRSAYAAVLIPLCAYTLMSMYTSPWTYLWLLAPAAVCGFTYLAGGSTPGRCRLFGMGFVYFAAVNHLASQWWLVAFATSPGRDHIDAVELINRILNALHYVGLIGLCVMLVWEVSLLVAPSTPALSGASS